MQICLNAVAVYQTYGIYDASVVAVDVVELQGRAWMTVDRQHFLAKQIIYDRALADIGNADHYQIIVNPVGYLLAEFTSEITAHAS